MYITQAIHWILMLVFLWAIVQAWRSSRCTETTQAFKAFALLLLFYLCYLLFPWLLLSLWQWWRGELSHLQAISSLLIAAVVIYARFIEPHRIAIKHSHLLLDPQRPLADTVKVALIADLHIGLYSGKERQLQQIVHKINQQQPDLVVVAGDWTYEPEQHLASELRVLRQIRCPIYSVNGNHDEQFPGPPIQHLLAEALSANQVSDIENKIVEFDQFRLLGVGDLWAGKANLSMLPDLPQDKPWLILAHNPDTVALVPPLSSKPLMLSGHTHGGQIEIPWLTSYVMKKISILGHKRGLYEHDTARVYVTVGTGMVGAPFRFRVPPTVDVIYLH
jgi:predicted MPP superfamily phosphohydrolase